MSTIRKDGTNRKLLSRSITLLMMMLVRMAPDSFEMSKSINSKKTTKRPKSQRRTSSCPHSRTDSLMRRLTRPGRTTSSRLSRRRKNSRVLKLRWVWSKGLTNRSMIATCPRLTSSSASVRSQTGWSAYKIRGHFWWSSYWMSISSCLQQSTSHSLINRCAITQYYTSSLKSHVFSRPKKDALCYSALKCIGRLKSLSKTYRTH